MEVWKRERAGDGGGRFKDGEKREEFRMGKRGKD